MMTETSDPRVVVIAEDSCLSSFLRCILSRAGYQTVEVDPRQVKNLAGSGKMHIKVLLITNAPQAFRTLAGLCPLVYTTSTPNPALAQGFQPCCILRKPFHAEQLLQALRDVCETVVV